MILEIENVSLRNFLSFGNSPQTLKLEKGINLILGSNGRGKSSLIDSIPYALFGKMNRDITKEGIINWKNRKNCEVSISFKKNNDNYVIIRAIKPDKLELYKNNQLIPPPRNVKDYQKQIEEEIIGMDFKTAISLIYCNLNSSEPMLKMSKPRKREFIGKLFDLSIYSSLNEKCNEKLLKTDKTILELSSDKSKNLVVVDEIINKIKEYEDNIKRIETLNTKKILEDLMMKYDEGILNEKQVELENIESKILLYKSTDIKLKIIETKLNSKTKYLTNKIRELERNSEKVKNDKEKLALLISEKNSFGNISKEINEKSIERDKLIDLEIKLTSKIEEIKFNIRENDNEYLRKTKNLDSLMNESKCPLCEQEVKQNNVIEKIEEEVEVLKNKTAEFAKELLLVKEEKDNLKPVLNELIRIVKKFENDKEKLNKLNMDILSLQYTNNNIYEQFYIDKKKKALLKLEEYLIGVSKKSNTNNKILGENVILLEDTRKVIKDIDEIYYRIKVLEDRLKNEEQTKEEVNKSINNEKARMEELKNNVREVTNKLGKLNNLKDYLVVIKNTCKDEEIRQYAISSIVPFINKRVNHYLSSIGHPFFVTVDGWLDIDIKGPGINNGSYGNLSGGESRSLDIALQMAFLDVAKLHASVFPDVLELDEILDSSIDGIGLENVLSIIKNKQIEDNSKIFIVSHRNEISDIDVDNAYLLEKINGYSEFKRL
jgi:DNA repair exonuclease SbcCD ATPase subunit